MTSKLQLGKSAHRIMDSVLINYARHFPIRKGKLRVVEALWPATVYEHETARLATLKYAGIKLNCDLREYLQRQFYFFATYFSEFRVGRSRQRVPK
jgi:hypothetical protein